MSSSRIVSKAKDLYISRAICRGGVSQVQWTLLLSASLSYFRPRVHCCVAWYNALPAHLHSKIEWVQMRALKIIYLSKLYSLLKSLDLRTGAVSSVWALWKYLQKAGVYGGACRLTPPLAARSLSLDDNTSFLINKKVGRSVSVMKYLF